MGGLRLGTEVPETLRDGRRSEGCSYQIAFVGLRGAGGNGSRREFDDCKGISWGAGQLASVLVTPTMGTWGLGFPSIRPWPGWAALCIWDADFNFAGNAYPAILQEMLTRR
jgi:hypothetical protein